LLEAMARLRNPAVLRVIGAGPELERLKRLADRLRLGERGGFARPGPFARLAAEDRRAALFLLPSLQGGVRLVFLEAMAAGGPAAAARASTSPEVLGGRRPLVPPGDPGSLASALDTLLEALVKRSAMAADALGRVERFEAGAVAGEFLEAIGLGAGRWEKRPAFYPLRTIKEARAPDSGPPEAARP